MNNKTLKENKFFVAGATAFLSGALSLVLNKLDNKTLILLLIVYFIIIFLYIISTIKLSLTKSLLIAIFTSIVIYKFSTDAAINLLEMAFLGSFAAEFVKKDLNPKIGIPLISVILTILAFVEIKFGKNNAYDLLIKTLGPYLIGFIFLVSNLLTYIVYYFACIYIKKTDAPFENLFYPRWISIGALITFISSYFLKKYFILNVLLLNLFLIIASFLLIEGINISLLLVKKTKSLFLKIAFIFIFVIFPYIFLIVGFFNNLFSLHKKLLLGGRKK